MFYIQGALIHPPVLLQTVVNLSLARVLVGIAQLTLGVLELLELLGGKFLPKRQGSLFSALRKTRHCRYRLLASLLCTMILKLWPLSPARKTPHLQGIRAGIGTFVGSTI